MTESLFEQDIANDLQRDGGFVSRQCRRALLARLRTLEHGEIVLHEQGRTCRFGTRDPAGELRAEVTVRDPSFYARVVLRGGVGAGEAWMDDLWRCDDPVALVRILVRNARVLDGMERGVARFAATALRAFHALRRNTRSGSRRNIREHYDLGNDFFRLFLDESLTYSCGTFVRGDMTLGEASEAKYDRICRKLELAPAHHVVEIGTGWGGFALHAASRYGCRVTTTTISEAQYAVAQERVRSAGLEDRITVLLRDYRDLEGRFDRLVSIEMIEAVGADHLEAYLRKCSDLLAPEGSMCLQAITIADQRYEDALGRVDFIQRYIFPGGFIPSVTAIITAATRATDLRLFHLDDQGRDYARTLQFWRERLRDNASRARALGFGDRFLRMWDWYFCYCEGGFAERQLGSVQALFVKPLARPVPLLAGV